MSRLQIVVEKASDWSSYHPSEDLILAKDYLKQPISAGEEERTQVINLCRSYRYLGTGYYVSLLAEARGHKVVPSVRTLNDLRRRSLYGVDVEDLNQRFSRMQKQVALDSDEFEILVCFGETDYEPLRDIARQVFEAFPCPILKIGFEREGRWRIESVRPGSLASLEDDQEDRFAAALDRYSKTVWRNRRSRRRYRYDIAMLHDPAEQLPPSNRKALKSFISAGKELGIEVDLITRADYARLAEYDALFIRETTSLDHHTYRFANRAEKEGMVVVDDPTSILRCTNKIYLADLLKSRKIATPKTEILYRDEPGSLQAVADSLGFPIVLKVPDGSFSRGVVKAEDAAALKSAADALFQQSALLLAQEFMPTDYDWRIGIFNREPIYACQYYMSRGHWQIYNHGAKKGSDRSGGFKTMPVREVPAEVIKTALRATAPIGSGLYGVDLKQSGERVVVIEVNDNPNVDAGVEDVYLGEDLYRRIMSEFLRRLERKRLGTP